MMCNQKTIGLLCAFLLLGTIGTASATIVGYYPMDEGSGTAVKDASGKGHDGTIVGTVNWVQGKTGTALDFPGNAASANCVRVGTWDPSQSTGQVSVAAWIKWAGVNSTSTFQGIVTKCDGVFVAIRWQLTMSNSTNGIGFGFGGGAPVYPAPAPPVGEWQHVAFTHDGTTATMYINGVSVGTSAIALGTGTGAAIVIGALNFQSANADAPFKGTIDEVYLFDNAVSAAEVGQVMQGAFASPYNSRSPSPSDGATDVHRDTALSWGAGKDAVSHDVYFGTSADDVENATKTDPKGMLAAAGLTATTCDPPGILDFGMTYYWRVDEVNNTNPANPTKGDVWSFTVEPYSLEVTGVMTTASGSNAASTGPEKTVDGSGLNDNDEHGTTVEDGWVSAKGDPQWIQYEMPQVCKLNKMLVWNSNQGMETILGFGVKDVLIECSLDGTTWATLGTFEFAQATGSPDYKANTTVDFACTVAKFVKLTINSNWGGLFQQYGLSEVRFYAIPVAAREPTPASGTTDLHPQVAMSWRAGREATSHELYVGTDQQAVTDGSIASVKTAQPAYDFAAELGTTYYWKVVEVNQTQNPAAWAGPVWDFSTATSIAVDDFESYANDSPKRVFQTWIDGSGFSADNFFPNGGSGNGTGSLVGYDPTLGNIMETTYFHDGEQSMPLYYDNSAGPKVSEAIRTLDPAKDTTDWTRHGLTALVVWFRGDPANGPAPVYVKINNGKKLYNNGAPATTTPIWKPFVIDLASIPAADLKAVKTLTIGVGDGSAGGTGTILIDDIRLYATAPAVAVPTDPGANGLEALYSMEGDVKDSSGKGRDGTANGGPVYVDGPTGYGRALSFDGTDDYVELPIGNLISTLGGSTFAARVNFGGGAGSWQRVFDFGSGSDTAKYLFLTPQQGTTGTMRTAITINSNAAGAEQAVNGPITLPNGWHHVAVVLDDAAMRIRLYMDGVEVGSNTTNILPKDMGVTTQNRLGDSQWSGDAFFLGSIDDFRIYNRPLSEGEIRHLAGDR